MLLDARASLSILCLLAACGGTVDRPQGTRSNNNSSNNNSNPTVVADHPTLCNQACQRPTDGPCASADLGSCTSRCAAQTNGLSESCAACLAATSDYAGRKCTCYGAGCTLCPFAPEPLACNSAGPDDTCSAAEESCAGLEVARIVGGPCEATCLADAPDLTDTLQDRCAQICAHAPAQCASASQATCISACMTQAQAVVPACAVCRIERSGWAGERCTCYGTGCTLCPFAPSPTACRGPGPEESCAAAEESCDGLEFAEPTGACADYCG